MRRSRKVPNAALLAPFARGIVRYISNLGTGFEKAAEAAGPADGQKLFKWVRRGVLGAISTGVAWATGLIDTFPKMLGWLQPLIEFLAKLGS